MKKVTLFVRLTMMTMLSLFFASQIGAQSMIEIGTYSGTISYVPFYGFYNYGFSKAIYTTTNFGDNMPKLINKIGYNAYSVTTGANPILNLSCWMKEVDFSAWTTNTIPDTDAGLVADGYTLVWTGSLLVQVGWNEFALNQNFNYSGQHNLAIIWKNMDGAYSGNRYASWSRFTGATNQIVYRYFDSPVPPPFGTGTYSTTPPLLRVYFFPPTEGTVTGTVTDALTDLPISGALMRVYSMFGEVFSFTDGAGHYSMTIGTMGNYSTVEANKAGYDVASVEVIIPPEGTVVADLELSEAKVPVSGVLAQIVQADANVVKVTWSIPEGFYEIIYDDGNFENMIAWQTPGNYNALKFTPDGYPCTIHYGSVNIGDGTYPTGGDIFQEFTIAIFDDDGADGMPGTKLAEVDVTPEETGWVLWDISDRPVVITSGNFYVAMEQGGSYPDCAPIAIDETSPVFRSYQKFGTGPWYESAFNDFMIRAVVSSPGGAGANRADKSVIHQGTRPPRDTYMSLSDPKMKMGYEGEGLYSPVDGGDAPRALSHYKVYRMQEGDETNPGNWTLLAGYVTNTVYYDNSWISIPDGGYRWAVVAVYDAGDSPAAISNLLGKNWTSDVTINITLSSNQSPEGAYVTFINQDGLPEHSYSAVAGPTGVVEFKGAWNGTYDLTILMAGYDPYILNDYVLSGNVTWDVELQEITDPPKNLYVDPLTLLATWEKPGGMTEVCFYPFQSQAQYDEWTENPTSSNWAYYTSLGNPAPCAYFNWSPSVTNYTHTLTSQVYDCKFFTFQLTLEFDVYLNNFSATNQEHLAIEVFDGTEWITIRDFVNSSSIAWTHYAEQVQDYANENFQIRLKAYGADCYNINYWGVDNVRLWNYSEKNPIGFTVYLDDFISGFTTETFFQYDPNTIYWGQTYVSGVSCYYASGHSPRINYTWTSAYLPPPSNLQGEDVGHTAHLTWDLPSGQGDAYWIIYDNGNADNAMAWYDPGGETAVRFTPLAWPCTLQSFQMYIWDGTWPAGNIYVPFRIRIYAADGSGGYPGTLLGQKDVTPTTAYWVTFDLSDLNIVISSGDFYLAHWQLGVYPNCAPTGISSSSAGTGRGLDHAVGEAWGAPDYDLYLIRAGVFGSMEGNYVLEPSIIHPPSTESIDPTASASINAPNGQALSGEVKLGKANYNNGENREPEYGELISFNIFRDGVQIANVAPSQGGSQEYFDQGLAAGFYDYEVSAVYDNPTPGESGKEGPTTVYINGEGTIYGTVSKYGSQFLPIEGALVTATGSWGSFMGYTGNNGSYILEGVTEDTYTMTVEADGFETQVLEGVVLADEQNLEVNFELYEFPYPVIGVTATRNAAHTEVLVDWYEYSDFYTIFYDDNEADNVTAWQKGGSMHALRFTPMAYPAEIYGVQINIFDGSWPAGANLQPFEVIVYADNGPDGMPGSELGRTMVEPFAYGWVDVNFTDQELTLTSGDFYVAMVQMGDYPNCVPIAIDEDAMVYRSYSRDVSVNGPWMVSELADFMMRAFVYDEEKGMSILGYTENTRTVNIESLGDNALTMNTPKHVSGTYTVGDGSFKPVKENEVSRNIESYTVYLVEQGDETNPAAWVEKAEVTETSYLDTDWTTYAKGWYRYAVTANYTYNVSEPSLSNLVPNGFEHSVTINVRTNDGSPATGAIVNLAREDGNPSYVYTAVVPQNGVVFFNKVVWDGIYKLDITKDYYNPYALSGLAIYADITLNIQLVEIFLPPACFFVDNMTGVATWCPPVLEYQTAFEEGFEGGVIPSGWTQEYLSDTQTPWTVRTGGAQGVPEIAHEGQYNAYFVGSTAITRLITPPINLANAMVPKLSFWHAQPVGAGQDELKIYYKTAPNALWKTLTGYFEDIPNWRHEEINLPMPTGTYQIGFAGDSPQSSGMGISLDEIKISVGVMPDGRAPSTARALEGYNVYLNGIQLAFTQELTYTYTDLVLGQFYVAGVQAVYSGGESIILEVPFTYYTCDFFAPPLNFTGAVNGMNVILNWELPAGIVPVEYLIKYDDGVPENAVQWYDPGSEFAVRFTPKGYPCDILKFHMHIWDGTWPAGDILNPFRIVVYDDDGPNGFPGTELGQMDVTPENYQWVVFDISSLGITINDGDFYLSHWQLGVNPNCPPTAIDETSAGQGRSYERQGGGAWVEEVSYDHLMIRATVYGISIGGQVLEPVTVQRTNNAIDPSAVTSLKPSGVTPPVGDITLGDGQIEVTNSRGGDFILKGFNVWKDNVKLTPIPVASTVYIDHCSPGGLFEYNVTAAYDFGQSCPFDPPFIANVGGDLQPPVDLQAFLLENDDVLLTWSPPGAPTGEWIAWDDGVYDSRLGLTGITEPTSWFAAARFPVTDLLPYDGMYLTKIRFVAAEATTIATYSVKAWVGENAALEVASQDAPSPIINDWNTITLDDPYLIDATQELWFGVEIVQVADGYPMGMDAVTNYDGKGNKIFYEGAWYNLLSDFGIEGDFNVEAYVATEAANYAPVIPIAREEVKSPGNTTLGVAKADNPAYAPNEDTRGLMGYNLWRNGNNVAYIPTPDTSYTDAGLYPGNYEYYVSAVYTEGESWAEGPASATVTGRGTLKGYVFNAQSGAPVVGATISLPGGYTAQTGYDGKYNMANAPAGTYDVTCIAQGFNTKTIPGVVIKHQEITVLDFGLFDVTVAVLPFFEPWDAASFDAQGWTFDPTPSPNWIMNDADGNPAPTAAFQWYPAVENYSMALVSPRIDATTALNNVSLKFDLFLSGYSYLANNFLKVEVWNGTNWIEVAEFDDAEDIAWTTFKYDITDEALGQLTKVRFVGHGADSYDFNWWYVDNIKVYESVTYTLYGTVTELAGGAPIEGATVSVEGYDPAYTSATGEYFVDVEPGTYDVVCSAECFNPIVVYNLAITGDLLKNFALNQPILVVDPGQIVVDLAPYGVTTEYITITNDGNGVLKWIGAIDPDVTWVELGVNSGTLGPGQFVEVPVFIAPEGLFEPGDVLNASINITEELGCSSEAIPISMTIIVGMDDPISDGMIQVYPNPASNYVNLTVTNDVTEIRIVNYIGQVMDAINVVDSKLIQLNTTSYATGTYMVEFTRANGDKVTKSVVITR